MGREGPPATSAPTLILKRARDKVWFLLTTPERAQVCSGHSREGASEPESSRFS